jgi:hypothetical protein
MWCLQGWRVGREVGLADTSHETRHSMYLLAVCARRVAHSSGREEYDAVDCRYLPEPNTFLFLGGGWSWEHFPQSRDRSPLGRTENVAFCHMTCIYYHFGNSVYLIFWPKVTHPSMWAGPRTSADWVNIEPYVCKFNKTPSYIFCFCLWPAACWPLAIISVQGFTNNLHQWHY